MYRRPIVDFKSTSPSSQVINQEFGGFKESLPTTDVINQEPFVIMNSLVRSILPIVSESSTAIVVDKYESVYHSVSYLYLQSGASP